MGRYITSGIKQTMGRALLIPVLLLAACSATGQNVQHSSTGFHWLNPSRDAKLFEHIKTAFTYELKPDDPEKVKPVVAQEYKWISRVGVFEGSALVLLGERETRSSSYGDYFVASNYDLKGGEKISLTGSNQGFIEWKFKKLIQFDSSRIPDIVIPLVAPSARRITFSVRSALIRLRLNGRSGRGAKRARIF